MNEKVRNRSEEVSMNYTAFTYYVTLMHVCLIASSVKIIAIKRIAVVYGFKSPGWFDVETCIMFLGCDMPIQLVLSSEYNDYDRL